MKDIKIKIFFSLTVKYSSNNKTTNITVNPLITKDMLSIKL